MSLRDNIRDFFHGVAYGQYERELRRQAAELNDLFLLLCYMEIVGLPNPATLYLLDVYPYILEQFHQWHRRMGMDRSPLGTLPCCCPRPHRLRARGTNAGAGRKKGPVLRRLGRRRQDHVRLRDGACGE